MMHFIAPIWLFGLLPWAAVTLWLLWGRRKKEPVPFLPLWQGDVVEKRARQSVRPPPVALAMMILAMLLAVLAAAQPKVISSSGGVVTVLVDRGATMSAKGAARPRYVEAAARLADSLRGMDRIAVIDILTGERRDSDGGHWQEVIASLPRTALETSALVRPASLDELSRAAGHVVLLSDHPVDLHDPRFMQVFPRTPIRNVGIAGLAVRETPSPQVMVMVRNDSPLAAAELHVASAGQDVTRRIDLPATGKSLKVFVDLPRFGDVIAARLAVADDLEADNTAWLAREARPPRVELRSPVPDALRRMVEVYTKAKIPREGSPVVAVVNHSADLLPGDVGVIVEMPSLQGNASGELRMIDDPLTAVVDWRGAVKDAAVSANPPAGWKPLVSVGDRMLVAAREVPGRQVWVGFDSPQWPRSADFVVFWTNVFDWVGGAGQEFTSYPVTIQGDEWKREGAAPTGVQANAWPGVFRRSDGQLKAMNLKDMRLEGIGDTGVDRVAFSIDGNRLGRNLAGLFCLVAIACVVVATILRLPAQRNNPGSTLNRSANL